MLSSVVSDYKSADYDSLLPYDVVLDSNQYPRNIRISDKRKKIIFKNNYKNIFMDKTIFHNFKCGCCKKESGEHRAKMNKSVQWYALHLVGFQHKGHSPVSYIIENLQIVEYFSLKNQGFDFELLRGNGK